MPVTAYSPAEKDECLRQIDRLANSTLLHGSESLCKLLRYLAGVAMDDPQATVKEHQIAIEVFGRPENFDSRVDSTVRVQTGRLRSKLSEYYSGPGAMDGVIVEIPRGAYHATFQHRQAVPVALAEPASAQTQTRPPARAWMVACIVLAVLLAAALAALAFALGREAREFRPMAADHASEQADLVALRALWKPFLASPEQQPWVVFSNAEFVGRPETGMRYFDRTADQEKPIIDLYSGVGEALAIHELDRLFAGFAHGLRVKRGRLLSLDDAQTNNLIFVGSPSENLTLRVLAGTRQFAFARVPDGPRKGDLGIRNVQPRAGEASIYLASATLPLADDYALIALYPNPAQTHWEMLLAGTTTLATQAAAEFVCRQDGAETLLERLTGSKQGSVVPFEVVLHAQVSGGVPVHSEIVALRP